MTDKIFFIRSYAHAETNGIVPCDSIIGTVFNASKNAILAHEKGHTFSARDFEPGARCPVNLAKRTFEFWLDESVYGPRSDDPDLIVFADQEFTAKIVFFERFGNAKATLFERVTKLVRLGDARLHSVNGQ